MFSVISFQDWLPAEVVQTTAVQEGIKVVANQSLSNDLLKMLPKAATWQTVERGDKPDGYY